eukprot:1335540-Prorocentrum_lima.AAC.1
MTSSLVGSEMCIRDSVGLAREERLGVPDDLVVADGIVGDPDRVSHAQPVEALGDARVPVDAVVDPVGGQEGVAQVPGLDGRGHRLLLDVALPQDFYLVAEAR